MPFDCSGLDDVFLELTQEFTDVLDLGPPLVPLFSDSGKCFDPARKAAAEAAAPAPAGDAHHAQQAVAK